MKDPARKRSRVLMIGSPDLAANVRWQLSDQLCFELITPHIQQQDDPAALVAMAQPDILLLDLIAVTFTEQEIFNAAQRLASPPAVVAVGPGFSPRPSSRLLCGERCSTR